MAPLLPKLRGQFAEFLCESYLEHLRIFTPPTCVGLWYGYRLAPPRFFSAVCLGSVGLPEGSFPHHALELRGRGFAYDLLLRAWTSTTNGWLIFHSCVTPQFNASPVVQEF